MGGKKPLRRPLWPPTRATASNYYPLGLDGAGGAAKPLLRAPKKPAPLHGRLPAFSGAVDAFERARKCFLEWRYFFSIILSEFLKNRVAPHYAEHEPNPNLWQSLFGALETEQRARATRKARKIRLCPACEKPLEVMSIADNRHSPGGFDVIAHCRNCLADYEWFCDKDGSASDMKQYFFG